jgi:formate dehydrogenase subunit gamma
MAPTDSDPVHDAIREVGSGAGGLLEVLHSVQDALGYVPAESAQPIATALNLSRAEVHGVVTYYPHFRTVPPGRHVVQMCRAEACKALGAEALWEHACDKLAGGVDAQAGHSITTPDGKFTLEHVFCLGLCASSPAITLDSKLHARVTVEKFDRLLTHAQGEA